MFAWINFFSLLFSSILFIVFYVFSVSPAARERIVGEKAYAQCAKFRAAAMWFEVLTIINFMLFKIFPLPFPPAEHFPWIWGVSIVMGLIIAAPATWLMMVGIKHAGEEALIPKKNHTLYGGIYETIRHPQAVGEVFLFPAMAFFAHSPFLLIFSMIYFPLFILICWAEEQDLILRYGEPFIDYVHRVPPFIPKTKR